MQSNLDEPLRGKKVRHGTRVRCFLVKEYPTQMTAWCKFCKHNPKPIPGSGRKRKAHCSRQVTVNGASDEYKDRVRRFLWWWCSRASGLTRKDHQELEREVPSSSALMTLDELQELIELTYDSDQDEAAAPMEAVDETA